MAFGQIGDVRQANHSLAEDQSARSGLPGAASTDSTAEPAPPGSLEAFVSALSQRLREEQASQPAPANQTQLGSVTTDRMTAQDVGLLAQRCAPSAPASALISIVRVESGFAPLAIRVNGPRPRVIYPRSPEAASELAETLIAQGRNIDLGLAQINSRNLVALGLSAQDAFDPCHNLAGAAEILNRGYERALQVDRADRPILQMAYSIYNTGNTDRGLFNGYVAKVEAARQREIR